MKQYVRNGLWLLVLAGHIGAALARPTEILPETSCLSATQRIEFYERLNSAMRSSGDVEVAKLAQRSAVYLRVEELIQENRADLGRCEANGSAGGCQAMRDNVAQLEQRLHGLESLYPAPYTKNDPEGKKAAATREVMLKVRNGYPLCNP
jgi:hypothetical protein